jgi:hypothetical protein
MKAVTLFAVIALGGLPAKSFAGHFDASTDVVVLGKVETLKYEALGDGLVMDGQFTARLTVTRIIRGRPPSHVLTIRYIAHTDRQVGYVGQYHLRRSKDGIWLACRKGRDRGYIC